MANSFLSKIMPASKAGRRLASLLAALCLSPLSSWAQPLCITDDIGQSLCLEQPAQRIVALSPGATELLFAAGAGDQVAAVVAYSDYPAAARGLPSLGDAWGIDLESLLALQPDLVIAWPSGNSAGQLRRLRALGIKVFALEPRQLADIAAALRRIGVLSGHSETADPAAATFSQAVEQLRLTYAGRRPLRTLYQVSDHPLMTVGPRQLINQIISLCGGSNPFADSPEAAPQLGMETVLAADPEVIVSSGPGAEERRWLDDWRRYPSLSAVRRNNLFYIPPDIIQRPTPRVLQGARLLCQQLEQARQSDH